MGQNKCFYVHLTGGETEVQGRSNLLEITSSEKAEEEVYQILRLGSFHSDTHLPRMRVGLHARSHGLCLQTALGVTVRRLSLPARAERSEAQALAELGEGVPAHTVPP